MTGLEFLFLSCWLEKACLLNSRRLDAAEQVYARLGAVSSSTMMESNRLMQQIAEEDELAVKQLSHATNPYGVILQPLTDITADEVPKCDWCGNCIRWEAVDAPQQDEEEEKEEEEVGRDAAAPGGFRPQIKSFVPVRCRRCGVANYCSVVCRWRAAEYHLPFCENLLMKSSGVYDVPFERPSGSSAQGGAAAAAAGGAEGGVEGGEGREDSADGAAAAAVGGPGDGEGSFLTADSAVSSSWLDEEGEEVESLVSPSVTTGVTCDGLQVGEPLTSSIDLAALIGRTLGAAASPRQKGVGGAGEVGGGSGGEEAAGGGDGSGDGGTGMTGDRGTIRDEEVVSRGFQRQSVRKHIGEAIRMRTEGSVLVQPTYVDGSGCVCDNCVVNFVGQLGSA
jgi:ferredoxin